MSTPGKRWRHLTLGTYGSWLPGDPRGWRSRNHKQHSSGHHRAPPPPDEHKNLHRYSQAATQTPVNIPTHLRPIIGIKFVEQFEKLNHRTLILAVASMHLHAIVELPDDLKLTRHDIGRCKQAAALQVTGQFKPRLWARACGLTSIKDRSHQKNAYQYILRHRDQGAWIWTFRDE